MRSDYGTVHFFFWYFWRVTKELRETEANEVPTDAMWVWTNFLQAQKNPFVHHSGSVEKLENVEMDRNLKDLQAFLSISSVFRTKSVIL